MSRFAYITEDPDYEDWANEQDTYWEDKFSEWEANEGATVVKKPQEEFSPFVTSNS